MYMHFGGDMRIKGYAVGLLLVLLGLSFQIQAAERHHEALGGFSYEVPDAWQVREYPGLKYQILYTQPVDNFAPNVNFVDEDYAGDLDSYAEANLPTLKKMLNGFELVSRSGGKTKQGNEYLYLRYKQQSQSGELVQTSYFLKLKKDRKLVVTCTTRSDQAKRLEKLFTTIVTSIRVD